MNMVGASNVKVSLLDKLCRKNTGTVIFGSMASPMVNGQNGTSGYVLADIADPYGVYKELKEAIEDRKESLSKT